MRCKSMRWCRPTWCLALAASIGCGGPGPLPAPVPGDAGQRLAEHARRFEQRVEQVTEGVYSAIGFALANSILVVAPEGKIVIDTTESLKSAREIKSKFTDISSKPVKAILYTHAHPDHVMGAAEFHEPQTRVIAHALFEPFLEQQFSALQPALYRRGMRQFGTFLSREDAISAGIGPFLEWSTGEPPRFVRPTETFEAEKTLELAGEQLVLMHMPGETDDQIAIWLPGRRVLLCGDNYYPAFPNLYTIRGTSPRPIAAWIESLDRMRRLRPEFLVPSHGEPVRGAERIQEVLTAYRDGIQFVHDSVLRGVNAGKTPDELVAEIRLPPHLASRTELTEYYGKISWSVRAIYDGYLGWFDGNATNLDPLSVPERARRLVELSGGFDAVSRTADKALDEQEYQWAAELCDLLLALRPDAAGPRQTKARALMGLSQQTHNANARHYYQTQARELMGQIELPARLRVDAVLAESIPLDRIFAAMPSHLDPELAADLELSALFHIKDTGKRYNVLVRRGVAEVFEGEPPGKPDLLFHVDERSYKHIALGIDSSFWALVEGRMLVDGSPLDLLRFGRLFKEGA